MKPGDIVVTSHVRKYFYPERGWAGYKANKDEAFVFVYLGTQPRDGSDDLDPIKQLERLGWKMTSELAKALGLADQEEVTA